MVKPYCDFASQLPEKWLSVILVRLIYQRFVKFVIIFVFIGHRFLVGEALSLRCTELVLLIASPRSTKFLSFQDQDRVVPFNWSQKDLETKRQFFVDLLLGRVRSVGGNVDEAVLRYPKVPDSMCGAGDNQCNNVLEIKIRDLTGKLGICPQGCKQLKDDDR